MSEVRCIEPNDAARIDALPADDPLAAHARTCPRCGALLASYRAFVRADGNEVPARELEAAGAQLGEALAAIVGIGGREERGATITIVRGREAAPRARSPFLQPIWAAAGIAIVTGLVLFGPKLMGRSAPVLRGGSGAPRFMMREAAWEADGLHASWSVVPGADRYELQYLSGGFEDLGHSAATAETSVVIARDSMPEAARSGAVVLVRVRAIGAGDVLATSDARAFNAR